MFNETILLMYPDFVAYPVIEETMPLSDITDIWNMPLMEDYFNFAEFVPAGLYYEKLIEDYHAFADMTRSDWAGIISDSVSIDDLVTYALSIKILDSILATDSNDSLGYLNKFIEQKFMIWDTPQIGWGKDIADALTFTDLTVAATGLLLVDWLILEDTLPVNWSTTKTIQETILFQEVVQIAKIFLDSLAETLTLADSNIRQLGLLISEYLAGSDTLITNLYANKTASDGLSLADINQWGFGKDIADGLILSENLTSLWFLACVAQDIVSLTEDVPVTADINAVVFSEMSIADSLSSTGAWNQKIEDLVSFDIQVILDGTVYQCWVLNTDELYPSVYINFQFNSYAVLQNKVYAAKSDGIYTLEGIKDADSNITTGIRMNFYNMGTQRYKRVLNASFGLSGSNPVLKVTSEEGSVTYYLVSKKIAEPSKGHIGKTWIFDIARIDALDFVEITPLILSR